jgi:hypothetical protein
MPMKSDPARDMFSMPLETDNAAFTHQGLLHPVTFLLPYMTARPPIVKGNGGLSQDRRCAAECGSATPEAG